MELPLTGWVKTLCVMVYICLVIIVPATPNMYTFFIDCMGFTITMLAASLLLSFLNTRPPAHKNILNRILAVFTVFSMLAVFRSLLVSTLACFWNSELRFLVKKIPTLTAGLLSPRFLTNLELVALCSLSAGRMLLITHPATFHNIQPTSLGAYVTGFSAVGVSTMDFIYGIVMCSENSNTLTLFHLKLETGIVSYANGNLSLKGQFSINSSLDDQFNRNSSLEYQFSRNSGLEDQFSRNSSLEDQFSRNSSLEDQFSRNSSLEDPLNRNSNLEYQFSRNSSQEDKFGRNSNQNYQFPRNSSLDYDARHIDESLDETCSLPPTSTILLAIMILLEIAKVVFVLVKEYIKMKNTNQVEPVLSQIIIHPPQAPNQQPGRSRTLHRSESFSANHGPRVTKDQRSNSMPILKGPIVEVTIVNMDVSEPEPEQIPGPNKHLELAKDVAKKMCLRTSTIITLFVIIVLSFLTIFAIKNGYQNLNNAGPKITLTRVSSYILIVVMVSFDKDILEYLYNILKSII